MANKIEKVTDIFRVGITTLKKAVAEAMVAVATADNLGRRF